MALIDLDELLGPIPPMTPEMRAEIAEQTRQLHEFNERRRRGESGSVIPGAKWKSGPHPEPTIGARVVEEPPCPEK